MNNIFNNQKVLNYLLPFIGGLLYASGFPMGEVKGLIITPILGLVLFFLPLNFSYFGESGESKTNLKIEILSMLCFSLGYCLLGYYWIPYTLKEFGNIPFPFNQVMGLLLSLIIVPQYLLFILSKRFVEKANIKSPLLFNNRCNRNLLYAFLLTLLEYYIPQQFPAHLGHPWLTIAPYIGLAPLTGAPFFSFMSFWLVLSLVDGIKNKFWDKFSFSAFSLFILINVVLVLPSSSSQKTKQNSTQLRLVQANIGNFMKVQSEKGSFNSMVEVYKTYERLSLMPTSKPLDLIIWPETAYPKLLSSELLKAHAAAIPYLFTKIIDETKAELFVGGYDRNTKGKSKNFQTEYNATFHFGTDSKLKDVYHKMKLIPFGEGLPFGPFNEFLSRIITNVSYFAAGKRHPLFKTKNGTPFITHICYEILFSWFTRDYLNSLKEQPEFIVNLTNDSWYGDTSEPYQHLYLAHWRALEFNLPIVRMTNTGITSVLYPDGSESKRTKIGKEEILDIELKTKTREATLFQKLGFSITTILWILLTLVGLGLSRKKAS